MCERHARSCVEQRSLTLSTCALLISVSADMCEQIATVRRKFQRIGTRRILLRVDSGDKRPSVLNTLTVSVED